MRKLAEALGVDAVDLLVMKYPIGMQGKAPEPRRTPARWCKSSRSSKNLGPK